MLYDQIWIAVCLERVIPMRSHALGMSFEQTKRPAGNYNTVASGEMQSVEKTEAALNSLEIGLAAKFTQKEIQDLHDEGFEAEVDFRSAKDDDFEGLISQGRLSDLRPFFAVLGENPFL